MNVKFFRSKGRKLKCSGYRIQIETMQDMKLVDVAETKKKEYLKSKIDELAPNSKIKNI